MNKKDKEKMERIEKAVVKCSQKVPLCATDGEELYYYRELLEILKKEIYEVKK